MKTSMRACKRAVYLALLSGAVPLSFCNSRVPAFALPPDPVTASASSGVAQPIDALADFPQARGRLQQSMPTAPDSGVEQAVFRGIWAWYFSSAAEQRESGTSPAGYLIIGESPDDAEISGYAVNEQWPKNSPAKDLGGLGTAYAIEGTKSVDATGKPVISFSSEVRGDKVRSEAVLAEDGQLNGKSVGKSNGRIITYRWKARRL